MDPRTARQAFLQAMYDLADGTTEFVETQAARERAGVAIERGPRIMSYLEAAELICLDISCGTGQLTSAGVKPR